MHDQIPGNRRPRRIGIMCIGLLVALLAGCAAPLTVNLVALNDFHGNLEPSKMWRGKIAVEAGGAETIAAALQAWRLEDRELLLVGAGDLIGASPVLSSMWADEPTIAAMNLLGLRASALGNHEFDAGPAELKRQQEGGCDSPRSDKACRLEARFAGADFTYLAANVVDGKTGKLLRPAYRIVEAHGVKIGFIGAVTREAPSIILASSAAGLIFQDEADSINRLLPQLRAQGVTVFVVLIHEGGATSEAVDQPECAQLKGPIVDIVKRLDPQIRLIVSGHSHRGYQCVVDGRTVTQAEVAGHMLSRIALTLDPSTHAVRSVNVRNILMTPGAYPAEPAMTEYLRQLRLRSAAAVAPVATMGVRTIRVQSNRDGESALGDLVADSILEATRSDGVQIAMTNLGGIRKDLEAGADLSLTYAQVQAVQPFGNTLVVKEMSGKALCALLELQWPNVDLSAFNILQLSTGLSYRWNDSQPQGMRLVRDSVLLNGALIDDGATYRVAISNFLAGGAEGFKSFATARTVRDTKVRDVDALIAYLAKHGRTVSELPAGRIVRIH
ncbi:MAG: bifunctional metallophosphatase/5'-nucleotidase [Pseudomonadota bacterium]